MYFSLQVINDFSSMEKFVLIKRLLFVGVFFLNFLFLGFAADITWTGAVDNDWNTAGNWSTNTVPGVSDRAIFTSSVSINPGGATIAQLEINSTAAVILTGDLTVSIAVAVGSEMVLIDDGSLEIAANQTLTVTGGDANDRGIRVNANSAFINNGTTSLNIGGPQPLRLDAATSTITNNVCATIDIMNTNGRIRFNDAGATVTNNGLIKFTSTSSINNGSGNYNANGFYINLNGGNGNNVGINATSAITLSDCNAMGIMAAYDWFSDVANTTQVGSNTAAGFFSTYTGSADGTAQTIYTCFGSDVSFSITPPNNGLVVSDPTICNGDDAIITVSSSESGISYQLRRETDDANQGTAVNGTGSDLMITANPMPTATITYNVLATNTTSNCSTELTDKASVTVNSNPTITSTVTAVCVGDMITIQGSGTPASSDAYVSSDMTKATIDATTGVLTGVAAGNTTITYTDDNGCSVDVTVTVNENTTAQQANIAPVCVGGTIELVGRPNSLPDANFNWTGPDGFTATGIRRPTVTNATAANAGDYIVTVTDANGCTKAVTQTAVVNPNPTITSTVTAVCVGDMITIQGTGTPVSSDAYVSSDMTKATIDATTGVLTGVAAGNTTITYTDDNGCSVDVTVTVNENPVATVNNDNAIEVCMDAAAQTAPISLTTTTGTPTMYTINYFAKAEGVGFVDVNTAQSLSGATFAIPAGIAADNYSGRLTYIDANGCSGTDNFNIRVNANPTITSTVTAVCVGDMITIQGLGTPASSDAYVSSDMTKATIDATTGVLTGVAAGNTTITYTDDNGCSVDVTVTVNENPVATVNNDNAIEVCMDAAAQTAPISLTITAGTPTMYTINYFAKAEGVGFVDVNTAQSLSGATFAIPAGIAADNYSGRLTYIDANGCSGTDNFNIRVNANPTITSTITAVCVGDMITIQGSGTPASSDAYVSSDMTKATIDATTGVLTGVAVGNTTITYTDDNGCSVDVTVTVNENTTAQQANIAPVCVGGTIELVGRPNSLPDANFNWTGPDGFTATGIRRPTVTNATAANAGDYIVTVTDANGCTKAVTQTAVVNPNPTITSTVTAVCVGDMITIQGTGTPVSSDAYVSSDMTKATIDATTGVLTGVAAGNTTITYTDDNGCSVDVTVTVNENPVATVNNDNAIEVCMDAAAQTAPISLTTTTGTPTMYTINYFAKAEGVGFVDVNTAQSLSGATFAIPAGIAADNYSGRLTYIDANGCSGTDNFNIRVNANPTITSTVTAVCVGDMITIQGLGTPASSDAYVSSDMTKATIDATTGVLTGVAAGNTTITYTDDNGCSVDVTVTVNENPVATVNNDNAIEVCMDAAAQTAPISLTITAGTPTMYTINYFAKAEGVGFVDVNTAQSLSGATFAIPAGIAADNYSGRLTYIDANGCSGTDNFNIRVNANPTITSTITAVCVGDMITIQGSGTPASSDAYVSSDMTKATIDATTGVLTGVAVGNTTITYTDDNGCSVDVTVTVNENTTAQQANIAPVCVGGTIELVGRPNSLPDANFNWTGPDGFTATGIRRPTVTNATAANAGDYIVTVTDANGCTKAVTQTAVVNPNPTITSTVTAVCVGDMITIQGSGTPASSDAYVSSDMTKATIDATTGVLTGVAAGNTTITYTDDNGCSVDVIITVNTPPTATASNNGPVVEGSTLTLTGSPNGMTTYSWTGPNSYSSNMQSPTVSTSATAAMAGTYTLTVTYANGCTDTETTDVTILLSMCSGGNSTWTGGAGDNDWFNAANWDNGIPGPDCIARFNGTTTANVSGTVPNGYCIDRILTTNDAVVTLNLTGDTLTTKGLTNHGVTVGLNGSLTLAGGNYCFQGNSDVNGDTTRAINVGGTGDFTVNQGVKIDLKATFNNGATLAEFAMSVGATATAVNSGVIRISDGFERGLNIGGGGMFTNNACASVFTRGSDRSFNVGDGGLLTNNGYLAAAESNTNSNQDRINTTSGFYTTTGSFDPEEGTAVDGDIVICAIEISNQTSCGFDGTDSYFKADVKLTFANPPSSTGVITLSGDVVGTPSSPNTPIGSSITIPGVKLLADGTDVNITATNSLGSCAISGTFSGVAPCTSNCGIGTITVSNISACNANGTFATCSNPNASTDDDTFTADVTVTFANLPSSGNLVLSGDGSATIPVSSLSGTAHTFTGVTMQADGTPISLIATFDDMTNCTCSTNNAGTAPAECSNTQSNWTWIGGASGDWNNTANWSGGIVPNVNDQARFITSAVVTGTPPSSIDRLLIQEGAVVELQLTTLTVSRTFQNNGRRSVVQVDTNSTLNLLEGDYIFEDGGTCDVINDIVSINRLGASLTIADKANVEIRPGAIGLVKNPTAGKDGIQINNGAKFTNNGNVLIQGGITGHGVNVNNGSTYTGCGKIVIEPITTKNPIQVNNKSTFIVEGCGSIINNNTANTRIVVSNGSILKNYGLIQSESSDVGVQVNGIESIGWNLAFYSYKNGADNLFAKNDEFGIVEDDGHDLDIRGAVATYTDPNVRSYCTKIPTMSQWGLLIFGLLILNIGVFFIYRLEKI